MRLRDPNFCINCTRLAICTEFSAVTKQSQMHPNITKCNKTWVLGSMVCNGWILSEQFWRDFVAFTFALIALVWPILHRVSCCNQMVRNTSKMYETHHNISLGYNGVDQVRSLRKIPTRLRSTNYCINCTSSDRFETSFVRQQKGPKCTQRVINAPKHEFRVQWGGSGAFIAKNSNTTSWHKLLH